MELSEYKEKTGYSINSAGNQRILRKLVEQNVICLINQVVAHFMENPEVAGDYTNEIYQMAFQFDYENAAIDEGWILSPLNDFFFHEDNQYYLSVNLNERGRVYVSVHGQDYPGQDADGKKIWEFDSDDYEEIPEELENIDLTDESEVWDYLTDEEILPGYSTLYVDVEDSDFQLSEAATWKELCENKSITPYENEALEFWAVSSWLSQKLEAQGETVTEFFDFTVWSRGTSGQSIFLDSVIQEIALDMEILKGQKNEWRV